MSTLTRFLNWVHGQKNCLNGERSGPIEVIEPSLPPELRLCVVGGKIHCLHGKDRCCWCRIRACRAQA
jgi:hypothetical protein